MKKLNGWIPVSILLGFILIGGLVLMGYIFIIGRGYYNNVSSYELPEIVSSNAVNIEANTSATYKEINLDSFFVPARSNIPKKKEDDLFSDQGDEEETDGSGSIDDDGIHDYEVIIKNVDWMEAYNDCKRRGGHLARLNTEEEYDIIKNMLADEDFRGVVYLGGMHEDGSREYHWVDEDLNPFPAVLNSSEYDRYWLDGEPSFEDNTSGESIEEKYLAMIYVSTQGGWVWNDVPGDIFERFGDSYNGRVAYICEYD